MHLPLFIDEIISALNSAGYDAYAVGGCVRDALLKRTCSDYDIASSALPSEVKSVFSNQKVIESGIKHGTVTLIYKKIPIEITTFRKELGYSDHRRPDSVVFSKKLEDDLCRRDFTINALAYNKQNGIIDLFGGRADLKNRLIRCVGNCDNRFNEDALRLLRALRFASQLDFNIEKETAASILKNKELIEFVSKERVYSEIKKLVCGQNASSVLCDFSEFFFFLFPKLKYVDKQSYAASLSALSRLQSDFVLRFCCLFMFAEKAAAANALKALKADKKTVSSVENLLSACPLCIDSNRYEVKMLLSQIGFDTLEKAVTLSLAFNQNDKKLLDMLKTAAEIEQSGESYTISSLNISGNDLLSIGINAKEIKTVLNFLLGSVISNECSNQKSELLKLAEKIKLSQ